MVALVTVAAHAARVRLAVRHHPDALAVIRAELLIRRRVFQQHRHGAHARALVLAHEPRVLGGDRVAALVEALAVAVGPRVGRPARRSVVAAVQRPRRIRRVVPRLPLAVVHLYRALVSDVARQALAVESRLVRLEAEVVVFLPERGHAGLADRAVLAAERRDLGALGVRTVALRADPARAVGEAVIVVAAAPLVRHGGVE
mmetsp:Transcript_36684/g.83680  ORF Transcript_36684/g.83680 Transcript_36684/m.83680 type:complete len:201 (+) Transcript_36684:503-1105(+)